MKSTEIQYWEEALQKALFPVTLTDVHVGDPPRLSKRYRAIVPVEGANHVDPFAIVTERYRLIRNEDVVDVGNEAFERIFGSHLLAKMRVFNVVLASSRGSFFADFTTPELDYPIPIPVSRRPIGSLDNRGNDRHTFFLRVVNSYNRTQAVRLEAGICRWVCRNGIIFRKQSVQLRAPHHKTKQELMDYVAEQAEKMDTGKLSLRIGKAYAISLDDGMTVLEGVWQTLRLAIPPVQPNSRTANFWKERCTSLKEISEDYQTQFGQCVFSVLQAASQWSQDQKVSPTQLNSYQRRCGEMLERLSASGKWPGREENAQEQVKRIRDGFVSSVFRLQAGTKHTILRNLKPLRHRPT